MTFYLFVSIFPARQFGLSKWKTGVFVATSLVLAALAISGQYFKGYEIDNGNFELLPSPLIVLFLGFAFFSIGGGIARLIRRQAHARGVIKNQLLFLTTASLLLLVLVPLTNFILPIVFKINLFVSFSPVYTLIFAGVIAYAIVKQKLFDIRLVVARTVTYALALTTLSLMYGVAIFGISEILFPDLSSHKIVYQFVNILLAVFLAFTFQSIRRFFDKFTNRLFYRDAYDVQKVLNDINTILTSQISLEVIMKDCLYILSESLKIDHSAFIVVDEGKIYRRKSFGNSPAEKIKNDDLKELTKNMIVYDELEGGRQKRILSHYDIGVSLRLVTQEGIVGYILLGPKQTGNVYMSQDIRFLQIVSNEMAIAVQNARAFAEIEAFNITLQEKITQATKNLRHANEKLKQLDQTKDDFISMASHQLRTPLTSVKGYISMVIEGDAGKINAQQKKLLDQAFVSSQRMVYLIADLLNVSRLRTGKFVIEAKPTNLADVVEGEISQLIETAKGRGLELIYEKPKDFPVLMLDDTKIRQVIMNFADNAIYYTPSGGHIKVALVEKGDSVEFTVSDDGMGVPKSEQHHLFNKFYRAGNAKKARPDGTGLGLFMAKKVIVAQGGAIIFNSQEGKGSTFGFSFAKSPLLPDHYKAPSTPASVKD